jgi:glucose-1-phosphate adenylyltransferase
MAQDANSSRFISTMTKNTVALILAGGRGSRLKDLTDRRAKPAVPFGGKFRIIDFPLSNCINSGIRRVGVITQYKSHSLIRHIQRGWSFLNGEFNEYIELLPASQQNNNEEWYKGTADAVHQNVDILKSSDAQYVVILAGDHIYKMDYGQMLATHAKNNADMTIACLNVPLEEAKGFGVMAVDDEDRIIEFSEKPDKPKHMPGDKTQALASMGIYIFNAQFLYEQLARDAADPKSTKDFGGDIIPYLITRARVYAHRFTESCVGAKNGFYYWRDVGTVDAYWEANMELTRVTPELNMYDNIWPIWTYQQQVPPAKFVFNDEGRTGKATDSIVSGGCLISGSCVTSSVLFSNVRVHSYCDIVGAVLLPNVVVNRHAKLKNVVVDKGVEIPEGIEVGFDLKADKKRFYVSEKGTVLVTKPMLLKL